MTNAVVDQETIVDNKAYHTIKEIKNGQGPAPIKTADGWLHLAHGVRNTAAGLRYVLYMFMTDLHDLTKVLYKPAGYFLAPEGDERIGDAPLAVLVEANARVALIGPQRIPAGRHEIDNAIEGPALIDEHASTTVIGLGDRLEVNGYGHLVIEVKS